jgi:hypothetical protein
MIPNQATQQKAPRKTVVELSQEAQENYNVLSQKPEISAKVEYYKGILATTAKLISAIDKKIEKLDATNTTEGVNDYEICKFEIEKLDAQARLVSQKQFFEMWLNRSKDYTLKFEAILRNATEILTWF